MVHADGPVGLGGVAVTFDDERAVTDAGIVLVATFAGRLGIEALGDQIVDLGERPGAANAGAKVMTLVSAMALGADCIDDCDVLRAGPTGQVLAHQLAAPSTLGTFLRLFTFRARSPTRPRVGRHGCAPGRLAPARATGAWSLMLTRSSARCTAAPSRAPPSATRRVRGYHPILATRADTGEVLHVRLRTGSANTSRGMLRFCDELIARVQRAGATGPKLLRADSGIWSGKTFARLDRGRAGSSRSASACSRTFAV
jgi:hypothetical protein